MPEDLELSLRGPDAYGIARKALAEMERRQVPPTPLNYELWLHAIANPQGALGKEVHRIAGSGQAMTDSISEALATRFLPRQRLGEEIRDAGDALNRQLETVTQAIQSAQQTNEAYGRTLAGASQELAQHGDPPVIKNLVDSLTLATRRVQRENTTLEKRLNDSTEEVQRLREHLEQVRRDAMTDALTNIANRKAFDEGLTRDCSEAEASGQPLTLAVVDIDHFKKFNDTWGHQTGDQVLRYVASVLARFCKAPRLAARYGGEEFAMIFPGEQADRVAAGLEAVRAEIGSRSLKRRSTNEDLGAVTVSMGVAERKRGETTASLIERADGALYASKHAGRNLVTVANPVAAAA
jgi:diguanylate cyclase